MKMKRINGIVLLLLLSGLIFISVAYISAPEYENHIIRGPYIQMAGPYSVSIIWKTDKSSKSQVYYGQKDLTEKSIIKKNKIKNHEITIEGLVPGTKYYYSIIAPNGQRIGGEDFYFTTAPLPGTDKPVRIWIIGDAGSGKPVQNKVRDSYLHHSDTLQTNLWLWLGDNAYESGTEAEFQENVFTGHFEKLMHHLPVFPTPGNHDMHNFGYQTLLSKTFPFAYFDIFHLPQKGELGGVASGTEKYYSFDYGNIHFISLDTYSSENTPGSPMYEWLEKDLESTRQKWIICFFHHPPYSKGTHDSDLDEESADVRENLIPVLEQYGVDLVLTGHSHTYERTHALRGHYGNSSTLRPDMVYKPKIANVYNKDKAEGIIYAVVGTSGKTGGVSPEWPHKAMASYNHTEKGSMVLDVKGDSLKAEYINTRGKVLDKFTIVKKSAEI